MPLASPWSHAFIGSLLSCRGMCSFTVNKKCNLPLVCPQCSSYYKGSVVRCVGCVVPLSLTTRILLLPVWGTTIASLSAAFSRIYSLAFETGTLHIGGFGPCQIILLPLQAPEPGAIACGDSGEFKRTLYLEKHSTERGTVPEKPANTWMPAIFLRLCNGWLSKVLKRFSLWKPWLPVCQRPTRHGCEMQRPGYKSHCSKY